MSDPKTPQRAGEAVIEDGYIVIRVPIEALADAVQGGCDAGYIETPMVVVDAAVFAREVCEVLNTEDSEDGTSAVHYLFDDAFEVAMEFGAQGAEEAARCEACACVVPKAEAHFDNEDGCWICKPCALEMAQDGVAP